MKKFFLALCLTLCFTFTACAKGNYEYKIVPLGSLGALQKEKSAASKTQQLEAILNQYGKDGWEISEIFAVRTTFDPNVFFVIMQREI
ncbi:MAG: DUF4177 domain-containing protein [Synergistaceae bacterium]|nr:DUF4177 domain-containing protein [Synergistaceae bacterium]